MIYALIALYLLGMVLAQALSCEAYKDVVETTDPKAIVSATILNCIGWPLVALFSLLSAIFDWVAGKE